MEDNQLPRLPLIAQPPTMPKSGENTFANQPTDQGKASAESMIAGNDLLIQPVVSPAQNVVVEGVAPPLNTVAQAIVGSEVAATADQRISADVVAVTENRQSIPASNLVAAQDSIEVVAQTLDSPNQRDLVVPHVSSANNRRLSLSPMTLQTAASHGQQSKPPEGDDRWDSPKEIPEGELQFLRPFSAQLTPEIFTPTAQSTSAPQDLQISNVEKSNTESLTPQSYPPKEKEYLRIQKSLLIVLFRI
ncbi:OLC1v1031920C1 [Oldenlandia corymbosa var. corymbosa]|uniref:OLC1v1031920C1 n=1 Tax=Oldenlandia corymbosa var. corymbosa TaxID=529605 RepID=A0AAV1CK12_OLDCO|nr:OLC1v1031920C1 [Oldenlandia corymbosa var. corymbosa]